MRWILAAVAFVALVGVGVGLTLPGDDEVCACSYGIERPPVLKVVPDRVRSGEHARLQVVSAPGTWGLYWSLERLQGSTWNELGAFLGGPMKLQGKGRFYLGDNAKDLVINDIGFTKPASIALDVPSLEPGTYRLGQRFISGPPDRRKTLRERTERHYAVFEVVD